MSSNDELNLPWKVYFFGSDGKYDKSDVLTINSLADIANETLPIPKKINIWNQAKLEIRVCDSMDYCIMQWMDGERIFP